MGLSRTSWGIVSGSLCGLAIIAVDILTAKDAKNWPKNAKRSLTLTAFGALIPGLIHDSHLGSH